MNYLLSRLMPNRPMQRMSLLFFMPIIVLLSAVSLSQAADSPPPFVAQWGSQGNGDGQFFYPYDIAIDPTGHVYVVDFGNHRIQKFDKHGHFQAKFGSFGASDGQFDRPVALAIDGSGNVYVIDAENSRIQKFDTNGDFLLKWGSQGSANGQFDEPKGIAVDRASGHVYVVDRQNNRIQKFDSQGNFLTQWGEVGYDQDGKFWYPSRVAVDVDGNVYVADGERIEKFTHNGAFLTAWGGIGSGAGQFATIFGIATDSSNNVYASEWITNYRIQKFDGSGSFLSQWGSKGSGDGQFDNAYGVAVAANGNVYIADTSNNRIQIFGEQEQDDTQALYLPIVSKGQSAATPTVTPITTASPTPSPTAPTPTPTTTPTGPTGLVCNPSGGAGGLAPGTQLDTTFNGYPLIISVSSSYNPRSPGYLSIWLHGDEGMYDVGLGPVEGGVYLAPQAPATDGTFHQWYALPEQNTAFMVALLQDVFAKYNLCRNVIFGGSVSGGSVFYDRVFYPTQGGTYPAFWNVNCGGGLSPDAQTKLQALSQRPDIVARTEFSYTIGTQDFLFTQTGQSADYRAALGFQVVKDYRPGVAHCAYNTQEAVDSYFQAKLVEMNAKVNRPPATNDDEGMAVIGRSTTLAVLVNDTDPNGDPLTLAAVGTPALGVAVIQDGQLVYTPGIQAGRDIFTYTVSDGKDGRGTATVKVEVQTNGAPDARDDAFVVSINSAANRLDVRDNDLDPNGLTGDPLTITQVTTPTNGVVAINGGQFAYTPTAAFSGTVSFTYTVADPTNATDQAVVTLAVGTASGIIVNTTSDERNSDGDCSLREAIQAANTDTAVDACRAGQGADTIYLPAGLYKITLITTETQDQQMGESNNVSGDFDILTNLTIQGATAGSTIVDGNQIDRVFHVARADLAVTIQDLTVQNGLALAQLSGGVVGQAGGGVAVAPTTFTNSNLGALTLDRVVVRDNIGEGGIGVYRGSLTIRNSTMIDNFGAGIASDSQLTLVNSTLVRNYVLFNGSSAQILNTTILLTDDEGSTGIFAQAGTVTVQNSAIFGDPWDVGCRTNNGTIVSAGYNAASDSTCPFTQPGDQKEVVLGLAAVQEGNGPPIVAPRLDSPLRNTIPNGTSGCGTTVVSDQRGVSRPQASGCEVGAYELLALPAGSE